jgi:hypothetical protein
MVSPTSKNTALIPTYASLVFSLCRPARHGHRRPQDSLSAGRQLGNGAGNVAGQPAEFITDALARSKVLGGGAASWLMHRTALRVEVDL